MLRDPKKKTDAEILGAAETEETQERERERFRVWSRRAFLPLIPGIWE